MPRPAVDGRRRRLPDPGVVGAGEMCDRAVLRGHGDPVVGLGEHRGLAGEAVAQHREAVPGADCEGIEAVEVVERGLERLVERGAFAQSPGQIAGRDLGVVVGLEPDAVASQPGAQPVVVGQRAVVHEAEVEAGREGVGMLGRDRALGRHAGMAEAMRAVELGQPEAGHHVLRPALLLEDLDGFADAHETDLRVTLGQGLAQRVLGCIAHQHAMARPDVMPDPRAETLRQVLREALPGIRLVRVVERDLDRAALGRRPIDGEARAVGTALAHAGQHRREPGTEPRLELALLEEQADDAAHGQPLRFSPSERACGGSRMRRTPEIGRTVARVAPRRNLPGYGRSFGRGLGRPLVPVSRWPVSAHQSHHPISHTIPSVTP